MAGKKLKFPVPKDYPAKDPVILCPAERVIGLYNQETGNTATRVAKKMKEWFSEEALKKGWAACEFPPEVQTKHSGGCILLNPPAVKITVNKIVIQRTHEE